MKRIGLFLLAVVMVPGLAGCPFKDHDYEESYLHCTIDGQQVDFSGCAYKHHGEQIEFMASGAIYQERHVQIRFYVKEPITTEPATIQMGSKGPAFADFYPGYSGWGVVFSTSECNKPSGTITIEKDDHSYEGTFSFIACQINGSGAVVKVADARFICQQMAPSI